MDYEEIRRREGERAIAWLGEHWKGSKQCPICLSNDWEVGAVNELRSFNGGNLVIGGPQGQIMPVFPVTCATCGLTYEFSAIKAGVVQMDEWEQIDADEQDGAP